MASTLPYTFLQHMIINEMQFINNNVNDNDAPSFLHKTHMAAELENFLQILSKVTNADPYLLNCDIKSINLLLNNKDKINFVYNDESKQSLKARLIALLPNGKIISDKYDREMDKLFNYSIIPQIKNEADAHITHIKLACLLCYTALLPARNSVWYLIFSTNEYQTVFVDAFSKYLIAVLQMMKSKDTSLDNSVRVIYHIGQVEYVFKEKMDPKLITVDNNAQFQTKKDDMEVCYTIFNKLQFNNPGSQQTELFAQFLELNAVPYCMYNSMLPENTSMSVYNLYKLDAKSKQLKLGNVLFVNKMRTGAKEAILNSIETYYNACKFLKTSKIPFRIVGSYKGYQDDYKMAALDFVILMFATNANKCSLKYLMMNVHEKMFQELKTQVCRLTPQKVYSVLTNYDLSKEPLTNFSKDAIDTAFN
ncbi:unknown [Choristoneura fumiferana DEF multiple nucleopolyhedrovirus]|uniref:Uncharacterized protein n=1 Tax=Choristoneura fumiferana defective polyhedrosis virus TaxID=74660 RepID=Q6VTN0_NPVCD|nr:hypothetical protein CFDNVgORF109 [Choristoneura fumiferana DEF multiple nucleopolyhedrovirus]AAQ91657.1 unknown [Choristoneura fumiferana DEF multiple nucleopolyhedrovirus]